jgi:hypothetical protein
MTDERPDDQPAAQEACRCCNATCADGSPCRAWAVRGSDPPRCAPHGGGASPVGAPRGNENARTHGFYARVGGTPVPGDRTAESAEDTIVQLCATHMRIVRHIEEHKHELPVPELAALCRLYSSNLSRLTRLVMERYSVGPRPVAEFNDIFRAILSRHLAEDEQTP